MALIHQHATLTPSKLELLAGWLPQQAWAGNGAGLRKLATYRFDDPAGEVGVETFLLQTSDHVLHVPLTYRGAPLEGAEAFLVGLMEHSELGRRWVYDGVGDPVYVAAAATAILTGGEEAEQYAEVDGQLQAFGSTATAKGSGSAGTEVPAVGAVGVEQRGGVTVVRSGALELQVARVVTAEVDSPYTLVVNAPEVGAVVLAGASLG
ncbi:hypothetical protein ACIB24_06560 [Spongisporangium articulatum]|uniref:Maltokinase N-terminal cap domain-containing protein n=1 Tax=Spongisporangium articulatum TaxID=3362603 RepID=A0ABW8AK35_9ACTN